MQIIQKFYFELIKFFNQVNVSSDIDVLFIWINIKYILLKFFTSIMKKCIL